MSLLEIYAMKLVKTVLGIAVSTAFVSLSAPASAQLVVKIGHVGPLTGAIAHLGKDNELGAKLAIEDLNAKGIKIGGQTVKFELIAEDDGADPKQGTAAATKLVDAKVNGVIGHLNSGTTIPASKIYHDAGIVQISPSATNPKYTMQGFKTAFRVVANDGQLGGVMGRYAVKDLKAKSIAIIDDRTAYGQGVADEFEKSVKAAGGKVVGREFTNDKATDFNAILTKLKGAKPDVVFYGGMDAVAGPMLRQMKQLGIDAKFMGGDGICSSELIKLAGDGMGDGQVICAEAGGVSPDKAAALDAWKASFKKRTGSDVQIYAPYVYDATMAMATAMQNANSADPKKYLPALAKVSYDGVTGKIAFDSKGDILNGALTFYTYKGGKREMMMVVR
jgi:branched-chain amino acid transport system substrate-binding protein